MSRLLTDDAIGRILAAVSAKGVPSPLLAIADKHVARRWRQEFRTRVSWAWTIVSVAANTRTKKQLSAELARVSHAATRLKEALEDASGTARDHWRPWIDIDLSELEVILDDLQRGALVEAQGIESGAEDGVDWDGSVPAFVGHLAKTYSWAYAVKARVDFSDREPQDGPFVAFVGAAVAEMEEIGASAPMKEQTPSAIDKAMKRFRARTNQQ
jgi:hypothetical protein